MLVEELKEVAADGKWRAVDERERAERFGRDEPLGLNVRAGERGPEGGDIAGGGAVGPARYAAEMGPQLVGWFLEAFEEKQQERGAPHGDEAQVGAVAELLQRGVEVISA